MSQRKRKAYEDLGEKSKKNTNFTLFPYLATTLLEVNRNPEEQVFRNPNDYPHRITISCHTLASQVSLLAIYLSAGFEERNYGTIPEELQFYRPYFVMKDIHNILNTHDNWAIHGDYSLFLNKSNSDVIRNLYEFSKSYPVYLQLGYGEDLSPVHHFCLYKEKIFSSWGDKFYVGYAETDTTLEEFIFYAKFNSEMASESEKKRFQEITKKYVFRMEEFNVFSDNVTDLYVPPIYKRVVDALVTHEYMDDETKLTTVLGLFGISTEGENNEYDLIVSGLMKTEDIDLEDEDVPRKIIATVMYKNKDDLTPYINKYVDDHYDRLPESERSQKKSLKTLIEHCWSNYDDGMDERRYTKDYFDTRKHVRASRDTFISSTPLKQSLRSADLNEFNKYYKTELDEILSTNVRCVLYNLHYTSPNAVNRWKTNDPDTFNYNKEAWEAMESFVGSLISSNGHPMFDGENIPLTIYGSNYNRISHLENTEYELLASSGHSPRYIKDILDRGYATLGLDRPYQLPKHLITGTKTDIAKQCPMITRSRAREMGITVKGGSIKKRQVSKSRMKYKHTTVRRVSKYKRTKYGNKGYRKLRSTKKIKKTT